jgi:hypothetical protein
MDETKPYVKSEAKALKDDPAYAKYEKYFKMKKTGLGIDQIKQKMMSDKLKAKTSEEIEATKDLDDRVSY